MAVSHLRIQGVLRASLAIALLSMVVGAGFKIASGDYSALPVGLFEWGESHLGWGDRLMTLGVLALALTPAFRVLALVVLWTREKDWRFVGVACAVFATLVLAVVFSGG